MPSGIYKHKKGIRIGEKAANWKGGKPKCFDCGKQLTSYGKKRCISCFNHSKIGIKRPDVAERARGNKYSLGRKQSENEKKQRSKVAKRLGFGKWMRGRKMSKTIKDKIRKTTKGKMPKNIVGGWNKGLKGFNAGEKNGSWKGGITPENAKIRSSIEYRFWVEGNFSRDNYTCQKCKIRGGKLHTHHILNFAQYPELRLAIDNGITFCRDCHREFHKRFGIKNNNLEQVKEFLCQKI